MLAENHICKVQSQHFKTMQQAWMQTHLQGDNISVLMQLRQMFIDNQQMAYAFACEAYKIFFSSGRCKESDFTDNYEQLATYGVAMSNLFFAYNVQTGNFSLYTSSYTILEKLASQGLLKGKKQTITVELQTFRNALLESDRIKTSIKKGNLIQAVRLDPETIGNGVVVFTGTIPRSQLNLDVEVIVPFQTMDFAMQYINQILQDSILRVTMGDKVRTVTKNYQVLQMIYGAERANYLISRQYDARTESFYVPSVGASIYTAGITNLKLKDIDKIEVVNGINEIDLSEINTDYTKSKDFFKLTVKDMNAEQIHAIADQLLEDKNLSAKDAKKVLLNDFVNGAMDSDLYEFMKKNPALFNLKEFDKLPSKFGDEFVQMPVPSSQAELEELLKTGVFKILISARNGRLSTVIGTNNTKELARIYGKSYYSKFESEGNRLRGLEKVVNAKFKDKGYLTVKELADARKKFGLEYIASGVNLEVNAPDEQLGQEDVNMILNEIRKQLLEVEERKTVIKQPNLITVRSCEAYVDENGDIKNFYKNVDIKSVISLIRLSTATAKKVTK